MSEQTLAVPPNWDYTTVKLPAPTTLRIATQIREVAIQGVTLRNTLKAMEDVWLSLHTSDKACPIVEQTATKVKYQLVSLYAQKLIKYMNSIIGLDLVPLSQQNPNGTWKLDAVLLNIASNKVNDHEHLFRLFLVNVFGVSEDIVKLSLEPSVGNLNNYIKKTYDLNLGIDERADEELTIDMAEAALLRYCAEPTSGYHL